MSYLHWGKVEKEKLREWDEEMEVKIEGRAVLTEVSSYLRY